MAVKYKRDPDVKFDWNVRGRSMEMTRKKTLLIYGALGAMFFAIFAMQYINRNAPLWGESRLGKAQVLRKTVLGADTESPAYAIECEVMIELRKTESAEDTAAITLSEVVRVDRISWEAVQEGDEIQVKYAVNEDDTRIRIEDIALGMPVTIAE